MPAHSSIRRCGKQSRLFMTDLSVDARLLARDRGLIPHINPAVVTFASALLAAGALALANAYTWRQGALFLLGGALGLVLYHALFGFTSAWRVVIADGGGAELRAQMLMLAAAVLLFFPRLPHGSLFGQAVHGEYGAVGVSVLAGAFLFGLGMQLGGGCASGTLYTAGGGNTRMLVALVACTAYQPYCLCRDRRLHCPARAAPTRGLALWRINRSNGMAAVSPRPVAPARRRSRAGSWKFCHALSCRPALGNHIGLRALGFEGPRRLGSGRRILGVLASARARAGAARKRVCRYHLRHGLRHHTWRPTCRRSRRQVQAWLEGAAALAHCRRPRRIAARLWRAPGLWLQHRRLFQRNCIIQPSRLVVARCRLPGQHPGHAPASLVRFERGGQS